MLARAAALCATLGLARGMVEPPPFMQAAAAGAAGAGGACVSCPACPPSKWPCKDVCCDPRKGEMCPGVNGGPATACCQCGDPSCLCNGAVPKPPPPPPPGQVRFSCQPGSPPCQQSATGPYTDPNCGGKCAGPGPSPPPGPPTPAPPPPPPPPPPGPPPPAPGVQCDPSARPKEWCPGGKPCPQCGKPACPCPP